MRMMDKERRRKKKEENRDAGKSDGTRNDAGQIFSMTTDFSGGIDSVQKTIDGERTLSNSNNLGASSSEQRKIIKSDNIQTEIRTDDFVVRLLLSC